MISPVLIAEANAKFSKSWICAINSADFVYLPEEGSSALTLVDLHVDVRKVWSLCRNLNVGSIKAYVSDKLDE